MLSYLSLLLFIVAMLALYYLVPREKISENFVFGIAAGPLLGLVLNYFMVTFFNFWVFGPLDIVYLAGIPLFQVLSWLPLEIGFAYFFLRSRTALMFLSLTLLLPTVATLAHLAYLRLGLLEYNNWILISTFIQSLLVHIGLGAYIHYIVRKRNRLF